MNVKLCCRCVLALFGARNVVFGQGFRHRELLKIHVIQIIIGGIGGTELDNEGKRKVAYTRKREWSSLWKEEIMKSE